MSKNFKVEIVAPGKESITVEAEYLKTSTSDGEVEFKANHTPIIASTVPTTTVILDVNGDKHIFFTSTGIVYLKNNELKFCCDVVESSSDIDISRADEAKKRAQKRLAEDPNIDVERAKKALARANARIKTKSIND